MSGEEFDICIVNLNPVHVSKGGDIHTQCKFFSNSPFTMLFIVKGIKKPSNLHILPHLVMQKKLMAINKMMVPDAQDIVTSALRIPPFRNPILE